VDQLSVIGFLAKLDEVSAVRPDMRVFLLPVIVAIAFMMLLSGLGFCVRARLRAAPSKRR
jgi:hypothetical protein